MRSTLNHVLRCSLFLCVLLAPAAAQRLIAVDSTRTLYTIDAMTAQKTPFAVMNAALGTTASLAHDAQAGTTYVSSTGNDSLYTVDLTTGATALVGAYGDAAIHMSSIEVDGSSGVLYGCSSHDGGLYTIDRTTGVATLVGLTGLPGTWNLGYDSRTDTMFATSTGGDSLFVMNRATGAATIVGNLQNSSNPQGLAYDAGIGTLMLVDNASQLLYAIDTATGAARTIGSTGPGNLLGLAYLPGGNGSVQRLPHHCGSASIVAAGTTDPGGALTFWLDGTTGAPFVGFGSLPTATPFCGCTIGHEWALAISGTSTSFHIPGSAGLIGLQVAMQGLDLFGSGGCADPAIVLTDTMVLTIG